MPANLEIYLAAAAVLLLCAIAYAVLAGLRSERKLFAAIEAYGAGEPVSSREVDTSIERLSLRVVSLHGADRKAELFRARFSGYLLEPRLRAGITKCLLNEQGDFENGQLGPVSISAIHMMEMLTNYGSRAALELLIEAFGREWMLVHLTNLDGWNTLYLDDACDDEERNAMLEAFCEGPLTGISEQFDWIEKDLPDVAQRLATEIDARLSTMNDVNLLTYWAKKTGAPAAIYRICELAAAAADEVPDPAAESDDNDEPGRSTGIVILDFMRWEELVKSMASAANTHLGTFMESVRDHPNAARLVVRMYALRPMNTDLGTAFDRLTSVLHVGDSVTRRINEDLRELQRQLLATQPVVARYRVTRALTTSPA